MSEMIERVAKAMHEEFLRVTAHNFPPQFKRESWETTEPHVRDYYRQSARKGIEAMRELTPEMRHAVWFDQYKFHGATDEEANALAAEKVNDPVQARQDASSFFAMMNAALSTSSVSDEQGDRPDRPQEGY